MVNLIGYEGYQDLDGAIIFKPPYYNLDVTLDPVGTPHAPRRTPAFQARSGPTSAASYIREGANPFVVYLAEIEAETETEDEGGIKATRMLIQPDWLNDFHFASQTNFLPAVDWIDIAKIAKFGLREQPARQFPFLASGDTIQMYAYAVSELNRANRGYRTYNFTIPMRPELRMGFPMYIPHRDMYGYINSLNIAYQQGGTATMHITLDTIRKRPLLPGTTTMSTTQGTEKGVTTYQSQPNLVMQWTTPPTPPPQTTANAPLGAFPSTLNQFSGQGQGRGQPGRR